MSVYNDMAKDAGYDFGSEKKIINLHNK